MPVPATDPNRSPAPADGEGPAGRELRTLVLLAWLVPAGVLVQAVLAGQAWFVSPALFGLHGGVGHGVLVLAGLTAGLAWLHRPSWTSVWLATGIVAALIGQTGLGYVGRRTGVALASSLHVPLGVSILGASVALAVLLTVAGGDVARRRGIRG